MHREFALPLTTTSSPRCRRGLFQGGGREGRPAPCHASSTPAPDPYPPSADTRNAITSLQYEVHDLRTEELSDSMFGRNHHDADAGGPKHEAKAKAAARLAAKAGMQGEAVPAAAVRVVTASPAKPAQAVAVSATGPAAAQAIPVAVAKHAAPTVLEVAVARAALQRAVVARQQLAVEQKRELRGEELGKGHAGREQQLVAGGGEVYNAQLRANQAQKQAYMRSTEYLQTQEAARRSRRRVYGTGLPQLPLLQPLGPEAAAP